jgi:hypothetical protein
MSIRISVKSGKVRSVLERDRMSLIVLCIDLSMSSIVLFNVA